MLIKIGTVTKPQGLRGQFRVKVFEPEYFKELNKVIIETEYEVEKILFNPKFIILKIKGVESIEEAENLRGLDIMAEKSIKEKPLKKGEYKIDELVGKKVVSSKGEFLGELISIDSFGAADVFTVQKSDSKEFAFPNARKIILNVDENIVIDEKILKEIGMDL